MEFKVHNINSRLLYDEYYFNDPYESTIIPYGTEITAVVVVIDDWDYQLGDLFPIRRPDNKTIEFHIEQIASKEIFQGIHESTLALKSIN